MPNDQGQVERQPKPTMIFNAASNLERSIEKLQGLVNDMTGSYPPPKDKVQEVERDLTFIEVYDLSPGFMNEQAEKVDRLVDEIRVLLF